MGRKELGKGDVKGKPRIRGGETQQGRRTSRVNCKGANTRLVDSDDAFCPVYNCRFREDSQDDEVSVRKERIPVSAPYQSLYRKEEILPSRTPVQIKLVAPERTRLPTVHHIETRRKHAKELNK